MTQNEIPSEWEFSFLSDIVEIIRGVTYKKAQSSTNPDKGLLPVLRANNIQKGKLLNSDLVYVPCELVKQRQKLNLGDIVVAMSSGSKSVVGKAAKVDSVIDGSFGAFCGVLRPVSGVDSNYVSWFTHSLEYRNKVSSLSAGANINNLKPSHFDVIAIPVAPLAEQKAIADKLDTLLAQVESTKARLERIPKILKRFRQSVLAAAVSGKLTEEWRSQNRFTPPSDTWPSCEEVAKPFEIPGDWVGVALGSVSEKVSVGHVGKTSEFYTDRESGIPFLRSQNVRPGRISLDGLAYITVSFHQSLKKSQLQPGDLLVVRVGANRGDACVLPAIFDQVNCANIVFARPMSGLSPYLNLYFQSPLSQEQLLGVTVGGAQGVINTKSVAQTFLALPPIEEQIEIVRRVEQLFAYADTIETQVNNALERINNLTQSILAKAFRGELTEQWRKDNPDLISGENSAESLLEKIKAERAAAKPVKRGRKKAKKG